MIWMLLPRRKAARKRLDYSTLKKALIISRAYLKTSNEKVRADFSRFSRRVQFRFTDPFYLNRRDRGACPHVMSEAGRPEGSEHRLVLKSCLGVAAASTFARHRSAVAPCAVSEATYPCSRSNFGTLSINGPSFPPPPSTSSGRRNHRPMAAFNGPFRASTAADRQLGGRSLPAPRRGSGTPN
jgi:hypothetical protein